jgi:hypothetical protein
VERQLLVEAGDVFLAAGQAVEALRDDDVELLSPGVLKQGLIARSEVRRSACAVIR